MPRPGPLVPIFNRKSRYGTVSTGTMVGEVPSISIALLDTIATVNPRGISVDGNNLAISRPFTDVIELYDVSDPTDIVFMDSLSSSSRLDACFNLVVDGNYIYTMANGDERVSIIDISNPANIGFAGGALTGTVRNTTSLFEVWDICKQGNYVFVTALDSTDGTKGRVTVVNVSNPVTPVIVGTVSDTLLADGKQGVAKNSLVVSGDYLYVTARDGVAGTRRITVVDVSVKASPTVVHSYPNASLWSSNIVNLIIEGDYLYVTGSAASGTLAILDISNPLSITLAGSISITPGTADGIAKKGDYVYLCGSTVDQIWWVDVSNPATPVVVDSLIDTAMNAPHMLDIEGDYLYATCIGAGTQTVASLTTLP